jgi:sister chromatid cohesion protein PDS5
MCYLDVRLEQVEMTFIQLLHLLARHPDYGTGKDQMMDIAVYVPPYLFFL